MSIQNCFKRAGITLAKSDREAIEALIADGASEGDAIAQHLDSLNAEIEAVADQVGEQGGDVNRGELYQADVDTDNFKAWAGEDAELVEPEDVNDYVFTAGKPVVLKLFHGTTHEFDTFDASIIGNMEGQFGAVNYFTSSEYDAEVNYAGEGPDLTNRIERRAEQIEQEFEDADPDDIAELAAEHELDFDPDSETYPEDLPRAIASKELHGGGGEVMDLYVKVENPFVINGSAESIVLQDYDAARDYAIDQVADDEGVEASEIQENIENYEDQVDEAQWQYFEENESPLSEALQSVAYQYDLDISELQESFQEMYEETTPEDIEAALRENNAVMGSEDEETGTMNGTHVIAEVIKAMGYDSIILRDAETRFSSMDMVRGTSHIHIFDANNTSIKSVDNEGEFNPSDPNIYHQKGKTPRGKFNLDTNQITLTPKADLSTFLHESGHFFLEVLRDLEGEDASIKADLDLLMDWALSQGAKSDRDIHEMFASGFETYLMEGKAPTPELQPMFSRFKSWLTLVYKKINRIFKSNDLDGVELSDEVRSVMDRMVASEVAIDAASEQAAYGPMPVEAIGVHGEAAANYQKVVNEGDDAAREELTAQVMAELARENTVEWKNAVAREAERISEELANQPAYAARDYLSGDDIPDGVLPAKLLASHIKDSYGDQPARKMSRMTSSDGYHPDALAGMFHFGSGKEMVLALLGTMNKAERAKYIKDQAVEAVRAERGDMLNDGSITERAEAAIRNDKQAERLLIELRFLNKAAGKQQTPRQYFKAAADQSMQETPVDKIRPDIHRKNEIKARNAALKAATEGDFQKAATEQHKAVRQFYLYRAALLSKAKADKYRARLDQMKKAKYKPRSVHADYLQAIKVLVAAYDTRKSPVDSDAKLAQTNTFIKAQLESNPDLIAEGILESITSWRSMTLDDLGAVVDAAENLLTIGKANSEAANEEFRLQVEALGASIAERIVKAKPKRSDRWLGRKLRGKDEFAASHRKLESLLQELDGWVDNGPMSRAVFDPLWEAQLAEVDRGANEHKELAEIFDGFEYLFNGFKDGFADVEVLRKYTDTHEVNGQVMTKSERVVLALNWGNEGNREALRTQDGREMTDEQVEEAIATLSAEELQLINNIWEYVDKFYPEMAKIEQQVTGVAPAKVDAVPFSINGVEMRGGYYPLQANASLSWRAEENSVEERAEKLKQGGKARANTKHGSTIERKGFAGQVIDLSIDGLFKHVDGVIHDITHRLPVMEVDRILRSTDVREAAIEAVGMEGYKAISQALVRLAGGNTHPSDLATITRFMRFSRTASSYGAMGYSARTALLNFTGFIPALSEVGKLDLATALINQTSSPVRFGKEILDKSSFMTNRGQTITRDVFDINRNLKGSKGWNAFKGHAFWMIAKVDAFVSRSVWMAAYDKAVRYGADEKQAIHDADRTVARTQSTGMKIDLSSVEDQNELIKALTPMYSYFNAVLNMSKRQGGKRATGQISNAKYLENMFWIFVATSLAEQAMFGDFGDDEDAADVAATLGKAQASYFAGQWFGIRELSGFIQYGMMFEAPHQRTLVAPFKFGGEMLDLAFDEEAEFDAGSVQAITQLMPVLGMPTGAQANRTFKYILEHEEQGGDFSPWGLIVSGKQSEE